MTKTMESVQILLAASHYSYELFQSIFGSAPNPALIEVLISDKTKDVFELFRMKDSYSYQKDIEHFSKFKQYYHDNKEEALELLSSEYTYLFIGPQKLPAPPWESFYCSREKLLFQESTLKVRQVYMKYDFIPAEHPHVADDHLALELDFLAILSGMAKKEYKEKNMKRFAQLLEEHKRFLQEHLLLWVPKFSERIQESPTRYLYPIMASMLKDFLEIQKDVIDEITVIAK